MKNGDIIAGKWRIKAECEVGGQGAVYKVVEQDASVEEYALKFLHKQKDQERRERMYYEVQNVSQLYNDHLMRIVESNTDQYEDETVKLYYVANFVEGMSLEKYVESHDTDFDTALNFFVELLKVLYYCHSNNIIHRDIKPDNIMLQNGELMSFVLIDFGLSFNREEQEGITETNQQLGNRFILLPELVSGSSEQKRMLQSDITQAAAVFLYILTRCIPNSLFDGEGKQPHLRHQCQSALRSKVLEKNVWDNINCILSRCFANNVEDRYSDEIELLREIQNINECRVTEIGGDIVGINAEMPQNTSNGFSTVRYSELMNNLNPRLEICNPAGLQLPLETNVEQLIPYGIALPKPVQEKVVKYYKAGDFATATEHVWPRAINILRRRILSLGEDFVADMVETTDLEYVRELPAYKVIELASELGFIDKKGKRQLLSANEYYNYFQNTEAENYEEMPKDEANIIIKNGVRYILYNDEYSFGFQFNNFRETLKTGRISELFEDDEVMFESCPYFYLKTTVRSLLNLFSDTEGIELDNVSINMNSFFPKAWGRLKFDERRALADMYLDYQSNRDSKRVNVLSKIMRAVHGFDYVKENERSRIYIEAARKLKDIHFSMNNFYNEPSQIKLLEDLGTVIPSLALKDCITAILFIKLGNQYGTSWSAENIADRLLARLTETEWRTYLEQYFKEEEELQYYITNCNEMRKNWKNVIATYKLKELNITDVIAKRSISI